MGILIAILATIILYLFSGVFMIYSLIRSKSFKEVNKYFFKIAVSVDQLGNVMAASMLNDMLIKHDGYKFGDEDETISSVIGRNMKSNTLTIAGRVVRYVLDKIEYNHCINSIEK